VKNADGGGVTLTRRCGCEFGDRQQGPEHTEDNHMPSISLGQQHDVHVHSGRRKMAHYLLYYNLLSALLRIY